MASESVQLIADIYSNSQITRSMIYRDAAQPHNRIDYMRPGDGTGQISLTEFFDELEIGWGEYLEIVDALEEWTYPHYLSENAFRYADYWSYNPDMPASMVFALVNVKADIEPYTFITEVYQPDSTWLLVNKNYSLSRDMIAEDLERITYGYRLREETAEHFTLMQEAMADDDLNLRVVSAYRSYYTQERLHRNERNSYGPAYADRGIARPGHSEHQTGLTVDVGQISVRFQETPEFAWLCDNAYKYGFILRYPDGLQDIHGYRYEPWHWRYVGVEIATAMKDREIEVYEEFYGKYLAPEVLYTLSSLCLPLSRLSFT